ncbi:long-chain-fatty-acid--CoA ligase [Halobacillus massiliensis]|uniref:long-chain-fatty-acid--CoA ligase n=1 Tax=Halobacillus massiliensis TaxID=1926286 RepID=UPI0009E18ABA|nr:long-chain fatty acid--CoA ligase [Halobacillus massiliensis]
MSHLIERKWFQAFTLEMKENPQFPELPIYTLLENAALQYGSRKAVIFKDESLTYSQLKEKVDRLAGAWDAMGFIKGERIGLMISNHPDYIVSYYAAQRLGLIVVQINPRYTARELLQIIRDSSMNYIVTERSSLDAVDKVKDIGGLSKIMIAGETGSDLNELICEFPVITKVMSCDPKEDIAVIQYTGGTTGKMKGAMLTHFNLLSNVLQSYLMYGDRMVKGEEMVLTATPLYHVYAMTSAMNLGIYIGATNLLISSFEVEKVLNLIKQHQPTFFPGVPRMYNAFVNFPSVEEYGLHCLKFCSSGSAPLPVEVIKKFERLTGAVIGEGFGLSEASPSTHRNPTNGVRKIGSIGLPLPGTESKIIDEECNELPANSVGELIIKGPQIMRGYWRNEEETNYAIRNGWLYTGDLAMVDEDGYFYIVGRKKEMIINGGFNIYPQEIESVLYEYPDIKESAVVGIPDARQGEVVKAFVVPKENCTVDIEELKGHCYRNLTRYKVPKQFEIMKELPRNTVGKLLKRKLVEAEKAKKPTE